MGPAPGPTRMRLASSARERARRLVPTGPRASAGPRLGDDVVLARRNWVRRRGRRYRGHARRTEGFFHARLDDRNVEPRRQDLVQERPRDDVVFWIIGEALPPPRALREAHPFQYHGPDVRQFRGPFFEDDVF